MNQIKCGNCESVFPQRDLSHSTERGARKTCICPKCKTLLNNMTIKQFLMTGQMIASALIAPLLTPIFIALILLALKTGNNLYYAYTILLFAVVVFAGKKIMQRFVKPILLTPVQKV